MFIGRWQPWHDGHQWLIDQRIKKGKNICIAIRDVEPNENQPWTPQEVEENLNKRFAKEIKNGSIKIVINYAATATFKSINRLDHTRG